MGKRNLRVEIPRNSDDLLKLAKLIIAKHLADGVNSKLAGMDMSRFTDKTTEADDHHILGAQLRRDSEKSTERRDHSLGLARGQKSTEEDTVIYFVTSARDLLMGLYRGQEHELGDYGFIIATSPKTKRPDPPSA